MTRPPNSVGAAPDYIAGLYRFHDRVRILMPRFPEQRARTCREGQTEAR